MDAAFFDLMKEESVKATWQPPAGPLRVPPRSPRSAPMTDRPCPAVGSPVSIVSVVPIQGPLGDKDLMEREPREEGDEVFVDESVEGEKVSWSDPLGGSSG